MSMVNTPPMMTAITAGNFLRSRTVPMMPSTSDSGPQI